MTTLNIKVTPPQAEFHALTEKYPAFVAGVGTGKSHTMGDSAIMDASTGASALIGMYEPTYDLIRLIMAPILCTKLSEAGIRFTYNKTENIIYTSNGQFGDFILRTMDRPERIIGYETFRAHVDELDTLPTNKAEDVWNRVIARNRQKVIESPESINKVRVYTTPEGFKFVYDRWVVKKNKNYAMVQAPTSSNPFLPEDYIESLKSTYPSGLIDAYLLGKFVNLTSGTVYRSYHRKDCGSIETVKDKEPIFVGMDFNIDHMAATIYVKRDDPKLGKGSVWHVVDEIVNAYDTKAVIATLKDRYKDNVIHIYPDSSGKNRSTASSSGAAESDIALLEQAGFRCRYNNSNPRIKDRVSSMNNALEKGLVKVNADRCPSVVDCLEQQSYDANGAPDKKSGKDHQNDATTYVIAYEMPISKPALDIPVSFAL